HASAAPANTQPPSLVVVPAVGSLLNVTRGEWSPPDSKLSYQWLFCKGGSDCGAPITPPVPDPGQLLIEKSDVGYGFQALELATDRVSGNKAEAVSEVSPVAVGADPGLPGGPPAADARRLSRNESQPPA